LGRVRPNPPRRFVGPNSRGWRTDEIKRQAQGGPGPAKRKSARREVGRFSWTRYAGWGHPACDFRIAVRGAYDYLLGQYHLRTSRVQYFPSTTSTSRCANTVTPTEFEANKRRRAPVVRGEQKAPSGACGISLLPCGRSGRKRAWWFSTGARRPPRSKGRRTPLTTTDRASVARSVSRPPRRGSPRPDDIVPE
jgi:hypothetical protein